MQDYRFDGVHLVYSISRCHRVHIVHTFLGFLGPKVFRGWDPGLKMLCSVSGLGMYRILGFIGSIAFAGFTGLN